MTVLQLASKLPQLADEKTVTADRTAYLHGRRVGYQQGLAEGLEAGAFLKSPLYQDNQRLCLVPKGIVDALLSIEAVTVVLPNGWTVVVVRGDVQTAMDIETAWTTVGRLARDLTAELNLSGLPAIRRTALPDRISSIRWEQGGQPVIVGRLHLGP